VVKRIGRGVRIPQLLKVTQFVFQKLDWSISGAQQKGRAR